MLTRQATFKDYSKLAELASNTEFVAQWMIHAKDNKNCVSLITIDHKIPIAVLLTEYLPNTETVAVFLFICPSDKINIGLFLFDRTIKELERENKIVHFISTIGSAQDMKLYEEMEFKPISIQYEKEIKREEVKK